MHKCFLFVSKSSIADYAPKEDQDYGLEKNCFQKNAFEMHSDMLLLLFTFVRARKIHFLSNI